MSSEPAKHFDAATKQSRTKNSKRIISYETEKLKGGKYFGRQFKKRKFSKGQSNVNPAMIFEW